MTWTTALIRRAVDGDVGENRRRRVVVVEQIVVDRLEVPHALARLGIEADDAAREQVVAEAGGRRTCRWSELDVGR